MIIMNHVTFMNNTIFVRFSRFFSSGKNSYKRNKTSSNQWINRQNKDPFVKQAERDNYRCRSAYKLIQMDDKFRFLNPGKIIIDCGAAPGSWSQVAVERVNALGLDPAKPTGKVIGIDLQNISPLEGAYLLPFSDFTLESTQSKIHELLNGHRADVVLSDMAPKASGVKSFNHEFIVGLCFTVLHFSLQVLQTGGTLVCKLWTGGEQERLETAMKFVFHQVHIVKPESSRADSAEVFCLAKNFKGMPKNKL